MPGKPGSGGPVPKPSAQRRRRNKPEVPIDTAPAGAVVNNPPASDPDWHPVARQWFDSLARSGQAMFYEASDWATARLVGQMMSALCNQERPSAQMFASVLAGASSLLATEGDRRRLRLELSRAQAVDEDEEASVAALDDYRKRLGG